jgi:excisionase family DNA binding protein
MHMSKKQAAQFLGVSVRTIENYVAQGRLSKVRNGRRVVILKTELEELRLDRQSVSGSVLNRASVVELRRDVARLKAQVALLLDMHEEANTPLALSPLEGGQVYAFAQQTVEDLLVALPGEEKMVESLRHWADLLPRIDEAAMDSIRLSSGNVSAPALLLRVAVTGRGWLASNHAFSQNLELQRLHRRLDFCSRHVRSVLVSYIETYSGTTVSKLLEQLAGPEASMRDDILSRIRAKTGSSRS